MLTRLKLTGTRRKSQRAAGNPTGKEVYCDQSKVWAKKAKKLICDWKENDGENLDYGRTRNEGGRGGQ